MSKLIQSFKDMAPEQMSLAGGKGGALAHLYQAGFPVPDGFVILPNAFAEDDLSPVAWVQVQEELEKMRSSNGRTAFAVRSSALCEDSEAASFAGEFETYLDVRTNPVIREAIHAVRRSRLSERVRAYSAAKGLDHSHEIAVVVQKLVRADISGILFTADPVSGSGTRMTGNFIFGLGEDLVSGEAEPYTFEFERPSGRLSGSADLRPFARKLFKLGRRLEKELGCPQDIEWAVAGGKLYLLQSRPITTLKAYDEATGIWNSSLTGDYLWISSEVFPDVMTPSSWSLWQGFHDFEIAGAKAMGNIGGRLYLNMSLVLSMMRAVGKSREYALEYIELAATRVPREVTTPDLAATRWQLLRQLLPVSLRVLPKQRRLKGRFDEIVHAIPQKADQIKGRMQAVERRFDLSAIWHDEIYPLWDDLLLLQDISNEDYFYPYIDLRNKLTDLLGSEEALALLATLVGGQSDLASMGMLAGLHRLVEGQISREEYARLAGHRPTQENELMMARPHEEPGWIDRRIAEYKESPVDVEAMLFSRSQEFERSWGAFAQRHPRHAGKLHKLVTKINNAIRRREEIRTELTRVMDIIRHWYLRAGDLLGIGNDSFWLTYGEAMEVLQGSEAHLAHIEVRRQAHERLAALPNYPAVISGRFDPFQWAADPDRRSDIFDSHAPLPSLTDGVIKGYPGSAGRVEGVIRFLEGPEQGDELQPGEVLLASTTNVGWTPIFPRAAAVVTDIGAPLSHAAIVARELGIPAVVGCGSATLRLKTGDRVLVDGGRGRVELLDPQ